MGCRRAIQILTSTPPLPAVFVPALGLFNLTIAVGHPGAATWSYLAIDVFEGNLTIFEDDAVEVFLPAGAIAEECAAEPALGSIPLTYRTGLWEGQAGLFGTSVLTVFPCLGTNDDVVLLLSDLIAITAVSPLNAGVTNFTQPLTFIVEGLPLVYLTVPVNNGSGLAVLNYDDSQGPLYSVVSLPIGSTVATGVLPFTLAGLNFNNTASESRRLQSLPPGTQIAPEFIYLTPALELSRLIGGFVIPPSHTSSPTPSSTPGTSPAASATETEAPTPSTTASNTATPIVIPAPNTVAMRVYLAGCSGDMGTAQQFATSDAATALATDISGVAGVAITAVSFTAVGCSGGEPSTFLNGTELAELNKNAIHTPPLVSRALRSLQSWGELIVELTVLAPRLNSQLTNSTLDTLAPPIAPGSSSMVNMVARLDIVSVQLAAALPLTITTWAPVINEPATAAVIQGATQPGNGVYPEGSPLPVPGEAPPPSLLWLL